MDDLSKAVRRWSVLLLPLVGLCTGVLSIRLSSINTGMFLPSVFFGLGISMYFLVAEDTATPARVIVFLIVCTGAHWVSIFAGVIASVLGAIALGSGSGSNFTRLFPPPRS